MKLSRLNFFKALVGTGLAALLPKGAAAESEVSEVIPELAPEEFDFVSGSVVKLKADSDFAG